MVEKEHVLGKWRHSLTPRGGVRLPCDKARLPCDVRDCHAIKRDCHAISATAMRW